MDIRTDYGDVLRLNDLERHMKVARDAALRFEQLAPGTFMKLREEKIAKLDPARRDALLKPYPQRTLAENQMAADAQTVVYVSPVEMAAAIVREQPQRTAELNQLAEAAYRAQHMARRIRVNRMPVDYDYWLARCQAERTAEALAAREAFYRANEAYLSELDLVRSRKLYEEGFKHWLAVAEEFPLIRYDDRTVDDLWPPIERYEIVLEGHDETLPDDFPLHYIIERHEEMHGVSTPPPKAKQDGEKDEGETEVKSK